MAWGGLTIDDLAWRRAGRVDELIHSGVGNELMHGVMGKVDELIHCGGVGRVNELVRRRRGES